VSPTALGFGGVFDPVPDGTSTLGTITVGNNGSIPTTAIADSITGQDASQFSLTSDHCVGKILAVGATCTVGVIFAPTLPGDLTANFTVSAANAGSTVDVVSGKASALSIGPPSFYYGLIPLGTTSPPQVFTVTNHSSVAVSPVISVDHFTLPQLTVTSDTCTGTTLAPRTRWLCSVAVTYTASVGLLGLHQAYLYASTTLGGTTKALLSGTGV
jgi:hypothetical protein